MSCSLKMAVTSSSVHTIPPPPLFLRMPLVMGMVAGGVRGSLCRKRLCLHIHDDTEMGGGAPGGRI
ncbi:hypothetical protein GHT06_019804 [Daphnia sinensis]|uniref:Uncharacterized protein n=1 Tax=Daphnia sinensis TaxID=1820382 RepID=A0AAD5L203_9CRUS|nr:hypothetical protein GHT06_019804 [Daphnia sinensis]